MDKAIIDRIRKLLALSKSSNEHEAALAMANAQRLMRDHNIGEDDLSMSEFTQKASGPPTPKKPPNYMVALVVTVGEVFGVRSIRRTVSGKSRWVFYGQNARVELACYALVVLTRQLTAGRKAYMATQSKRLKRYTLTARGDLFAYGWVEACIDKLAPLALSNHEMVLLDAYERASFEMIGKLGGREPGKARQRDDDAYYRGASAGKHARVDRPITEAPRQISR